MSTSVAPLAFDPAIAMARQALYRFAALSLLDPKSGSWVQLNAFRNDPLLFEAAGLLRGLPAAPPEKMAPGEQPTSELDPSAVLARLPHSHEQFNQCYENVFGLLVSNACPPYETEYINSRYSFQRSNALADISGFYHAFGVTASRQNPERPDHIVHELEFMAVLIGLARRADQADFPNRDERLGTCIDAQQRFLRDHLTWWTPAFATLLCRENLGGYYDGVARFLSALIPAERSLFCIPTPNHRAAPSELEQPDACEGCGLALHQE